MNHPIRVAQILGHMNSGGAEAVVMNYYRTIDKSNVQFDFFLDENSDFPQRKEIESLGGGIYLMPSYSKFFSYHNKMKKLLKQNKYTIVHSHLSTMSVFPLWSAWSANVPTRICHNHSTASWKEPKKTVLKYILRPLNKIFATEYYACGEMAGRWMYGKKTFASGHVHIMMNAIDTEMFQFNDHNKKEIRTEFNISDDCFVIGHIGRFCIQKNQIFLLDIFEHVVRNYPNSILILVGEGELETELQDKVHKLNLDNHVIFTGVRKDVYKFYSAFDLFCLPSNYEGLPVVIVEAIANGVPIVISNHVSSEVTQLGTMDVYPNELRYWVDALTSHKARTIHVNASHIEIKSAAKTLEDFYCSLTTEHLGV